MTEISLSVFAIQFKAMEETDLDKMNPNTDEHLTPNSNESDEPARKCSGLRNALHSCTKPLRTKYNPLPDDAGLFQRFQYGLLCPPHGNLAKYLFFFFMFFVCWAVVISLTGNGGVPGGNFFSLTIMFFACVLGGYLVVFIKLPPLLGKLYDLFGLTTY